MSTILTWLAMPEILDCEEYDEEVMELLNCCLGTTPRSYGACLGVAQSSLMARAYQAFWKAGDFGGASF